MPEVRDSRDTVDALDGAGLLRWGRASLDALADRRAEINALNVFPVPDGDTGTNLLATMRAAVTAAEAVPEAPTATVPSTTEPQADGRAGPVHAVRRQPDPPRLASGGSDVSRSRQATHAVAAAMARGATVGARGNSGIILSQVLRGIAEEARSGPLTATQLGAGLVRAARLVRSALSVPTEGTILTVLDVAAARAADCRDRTLPEVARTAADGAADALAATPGQLGALRGVVDAGGRGLLVLLDSLVTELTGMVPPRPDYTEIGRTPAQRAGAPGERRGRYRFHGSDRRGAGIPGRDPDNRGPGVQYEVMFQLAETAAHRVAALRSALGELGDSVVVVGDGDDVWSVHVHSAQAGAAVEAGIAAGVVSGIRIEVITLDGAREANSVGSNEQADPDCGAGFAGSHPVEGQYRSAAVDGSASTRSPVPARCGDDDCPVSATEATPNIGSGLHHSATESDAVATTAPGRSAAHDVSLRDGSGSANVVVAQSAAANIVPEELRTMRVEQTALDAFRQGVVPEEQPADRGVLAVVAGHGAAALFQDAGAVVLGMREPVTANSLLAAIRDMPNREVLVLPNGALPAHELVAVGVAARDAHRDVLLLPSGSMVQGLAALAVHDRGRIAVDDTFAMSEAASTTRWGALRSADERALTMVGTCEAGDGLGLVGNDVVVIDPVVPAAGATLLDRMLAFGGELVTLLMGAAAPQGLADRLAEHIGEGFPGVEVTVYYGGQPDDLVQIGVE